MIEGQTETITGDEMIRQPNQSISGIDGRPLTDCDGQCGGCTSHRPDELDADGESGRCDDGDQDDPVLAAIDKAKWDDEELDTINITSNCDRSNAILRANTQIEAIRTAYLASTQKPSGPAPEYTEGICSDGAAILCDGVMLTISEVLSLLNTASADKARIVELEADKKELYEALEMLCDAVLVDMADKALKKARGEA